MNKSILALTAAIVASLGLQACSGGGTKSSTSKLPVYLDPDKKVEARVEDALARMTTAEKIDIIHAQSKFSSAGVPRLGIPEFWTDDGPMGVRPDVLWDEWEQAGQTNDSCIAFPALTALAASWDVDLATLYGKSLGEEANYRGKNMILGPGVNIIRTPFGGRNFEYMSEDPFLAGKMAVNYVRGLQNNGVAVCVKHFALNNNEDNRFTTNVIVDDRTLREIYLPAFEMAVKEGGAWGVMGAYNLYKNQHNCYNEVLTNQILKKEWGFDGVYISDWGGTHDTEQAVKGGLDMEFGSWTNGLNNGSQNAYDSYFLADAYEKGIEEGKYDISTLDEKARRVLRVMFRTDVRNRPNTGSMNSEEHYSAARKIGSEGVVLLKNEGNILPLDPSKGGKILVVGENAIKMMTVGGGSSSLKVQNEVLPIEGIKAALEGKMSVDYARGYVGDTTGEYNGVVAKQKLYDPRPASTLISEAVSKASKADYVIVVGGLNKAPHQDDESYDRTDYALPYGQSELIEALAAANPKIIFVNISGNPVELPFIGKIPAMIQAWYLGSEAGNVIADVLTGKVNPSGKLPFTWYARLEDCGAHALGAYPGKANGTTYLAGGYEAPKVDEEYKEGIYVGYRYEDKESITPTFAFGHGLSYTTFEFTGVKLSSKSTKDGAMTFTVGVKNTGSCDGAEVVQLYIHDNEASVDRPYKELKGFARVFLKAGQSANVKITIDKRALSFWDTKTSAWKAEPGTFTALIGDSSDNLPLKATFDLK